MQGLSANQIQGPKLIIVYVDIYCMELLSDATFLHAFSSVFAVLSPEPNALVKTLRKLPILHDEKYAEQTKLYEYYKPAEKTLVLP